MITGINHINIVVSDVAQAYAFFKKLGFSKVKERELEGEWIDRLTGFKGVKAKFMSLTFYGGRFSIELLQYLNPAATASADINSPNAIGYRHMAFEVDNLEFTRDGLARQGVEFLSDIQVNPYGKKMVYAKGPDNILVELAQL